jgi:hypothetical protein
MSVIYTRAARRKMRAMSKTVGVFLAHTFTDRDPATGKAEFVTDPRAVAALERACVMMLTEGGAVQVLEVARATAEAFPSTDLSGIPPEARHFLAVGLDPDARAAFVIRSVMVADCLTRTSARREVEAVMRQAIAPLLSRSGWEGCV